MDKSGQRNKASGRWYSRPVEHMGGANQGSERKPMSEGTHKLLSAEEGINQDSEGMPAGEEHSLSAKQRGKDMSGKRKKANE